MTATGKVGEDLGGGGGVVTCICLLRETGEVRGRMKVGEKCGVGDRRCESRSFLCLVMIMDDGHVDKDDTMIVLRGCKCNNYRG